MPLPEDYSFLADVAQLKKDLQLVRQWRRLRVITRSGEAAIRWVPGSSTATLDLRALSASGAPSIGILPPLTGHTSAVLTTNGTSYSWTDVHSDTIAWLSRIAAAGGTLGPNSLTLADNLARAMAAASYSSKIVYLCPLLGGSVAAAIQPLRNSLGIGRPTNHNFVDADFSEATGLQGDGSTKWIDTMVKPSQIGASNNGGLGWWETNFSNGAHVAPLGCEVSDSSQRWEIVLRSVRQSFRWGNVTNGEAAVGTTAGNGHYYGQRSAANARVLYKDATSLATSTTNDGTASTSTYSIAFGGTNIGGTVEQWQGRCAVAYMTDGTMSGSDVTAFHSLLQTYLITPTGR